MSITQYIKKALYFVGRLSYPQWQKKDISLFDVTLRDGLQGGSVMPLYNKQKLFERVLNERNAMAIEVGSLVSPKVVPQMENSLDVYKFANKMLEERKGLEQALPDIYMLVPPSVQYMQTAFDNKIINISVPASFSNSFQQKNVRMSLTDTYKIVSYVSKNNYFSKIKVYLSCFNECPVIQNKVDMFDIVQNIIRYSKLNKVNEICLSDTIGTLTPADFESILTILQKNSIPFEKLSLHLHVKDTQTTLDNIVLAIDAGITRFDVSIVKSGGCNITLSSDCLHRNVSPELLMQAACKTGSNIIAPIKQCKTVIPWYGPVD
jgi:hydroxymethylglutaryl-CoA lyase